jgi:hypothetical protein
MADGISDRLSEGLKEGVRVSFKTKNNGLLYSLHRPDEKLSGITDAMLCAAILHAGTHFEMRKVSRPKVSERDAVQRTDGRNVTYKESIEIDWEDEVIRSTKGRELTLQVLSIVLRDLSAPIAAEEAKKAPRELN